jgi:hypothetical protein
MSEVMKRLGEEGLTREGERFGGGRSEKIRGEE